MFLELHSNLYGSRSTPVEIGEVCEDADLFNIRFLLGNKLFTAWEYLWGYQAKSCWTLKGETEYEIMPRVYPEKVLEVVFSVLKSRGDRTKVLRLSNGGAFVPYDWPPFTGTYVSPFGETNYYTSQDYYTIDGVREIVSTPLSDLVEAGIYPQGFLPIQ